MSNQEITPLPRPLFILTLLIFGIFAGIAWADDLRVLKQLEHSTARFTTAKAWQQQHTELREGFLRGARLWPLPQKTPLNPIISANRVYRDYSVGNVALESMPGFFCTGNLYQPTGHVGPRPAILCPHGHFRPLGRFRDEHQIRCAHLARMGAIVFSYSMVGWQDSQQTTHDDPLVLALQTWNSIRVVDFLWELPEVDTKRIGVTGASGGGTQTLFLTAVDDRIAASAPVVIVYPWSWFSHECNCEGGMPVMRSPETNAIELAAIAAPRPQLIISCGLATAGKDRKDPTHEFPTTGFPFVQQVYRLFGSSDRVRNVHFANEGHDYGPNKRKAAYVFFAEHLGMKLMDEALDKIVIEAPEKMAVVSEKQPLPKHAVHGSKAVAEAFAKLTRPKGGGEEPAP
jgi:uncharacterized protein